LRHILGGPAPGEDEGFADATPVAPGEDEGFDDATPVAPGEDEGFADATPVAPVSEIAAMTFRHAFIPNSS
jgi:hypothetical protein